MLRREKFTAVLLIVPAILVLAAIVVFPLIYSLNASLRHYDLRLPLPPGSDYPFVGAENYERALTDSRFLASLIRTGIFVTLGVALQLSIGIGLAIVFSKISWRSYVLPIIVMPVLITPIVIGHMGNIILHMSGPVNYIFESLGMGKMLWHMHPSTALVTLVLVDTWQWSPFATLIILAGLLTLPREVQEASLVDGASALQRFRYITLPLLKNVIFVVVIFRVLEMLRVFDIMYIMTFGGPGSSTEVVNFYAYLSGFHYWDLGYASAIGWFMVIVLTVGVTLLMRIVKV